MTRARMIEVTTVVVTALALMASVASAGPFKRSHGAGRRKCHQDTQCRGGECNDAGRCCRKDEITCGGTCCDKLFADACCDEQCVDFAEDERNCGGCGIACTGGKSCEDGVCSCSPDEVDCGGTCANLQLDDENCGACGHACDADLTCVLGQCRCKTVGQELCGDECVDVKTDPDNCGFCGNHCLLGGSCADGQCQDDICGPCEERVNGQCVPKAGETECNGACVNTDSDPNNCGGCGNVCPHSGSCQDGQCNLCPNSIPYHFCPADLGGDTVGVCCHPDAPQCCFTEHGGSCCGADTVCCDGYCCGAGTQCCPNSRHTYACIPVGQQCPE